MVMTASARVCRAAIPSAVGALLVPQLLGTDVSSLRAQSASRPLDGGSGRSHDSMRTHRYAEVFASIRAGTFDLPSSGWGTTEGGPP